MTRSNLDRWEDCGEAPQGTSLAQLRSNVLDFSRLKSDARRSRKAQHTERSLDDVMREATEVARAAEALSRNHVAPTNSRPRGQSR